MNKKLLASYVTNLIPRLHRDSNSHKGIFGKVIIIGGASSMTGALVLAGKAALYLGAGWVVLEMMDHESAKVSLSQPELMIFYATKERCEKIASQRANAIAIGPGLGNSSLSGDYLQSILATEQIPIVIDADALNMISQSEFLLEQLRERNLKYPMLSVITPHPGEAARILNCSTLEIQNNRREAILELVKKTQSIVVLKGHQTLIASTNNDIAICNAGNPGMATGGTGDVLTGSIVAIASQGIHHGLSLWESTCIATQIHAEAADRLVAKGVGPIGLTPSEIIIEMRTLLNLYLAIKDPKTGINPKV